jgi:hypothetical protein
MHGRFRPLIDREGTSPLLLATADAYLPVRLGEPPRPDQSVLVYLLDGTGLIVSAGCLLRLEP